MRKIIHLDLDAFFCSVEELERPELAGKPFAVGGRAESRGVISSCSYAARAFGIHSAMPTSRARKLCPSLVLISGRHRRYSEISRRVMTILGRFTALIEQVSIDEAFMDVSDLPGEPGAVALEMQQAVAEGERLPSSLGVATNKLVAKMANDVGKARHKGVSPPRSIMVVPAGQETEFLAPLPVKMLWGIGPKTADRLQGFGIHTIGDMTRQPDAFYTRIFGKNGPEMRLRALGIDHRPIEMERDTKSISQEVTFERDVSDREALLHRLRDLSEQVAFRLRQEGFTASTVRVKVRWPDFSLQTRQRALPQPTDVDGVIREAASELFLHLWDDHQQRPVRLLGVGVSELTESSYQPSLLDNQADRERQLLNALDELRARFGKDAVQRAEMLKKRKQRPQD